MRKKLILVLALVAAVGLGSGRLAEDFCACGGSFADDPSTPIGMAELALPSHTHAAQKAVAPSVDSGLRPQPEVRSVVARAAQEISTPATPSRPIPIRC